VAQNFYMLDTVSQKSAACFTG